MDDLVNYRVMLPKPNQANGFHEQNGTEVTFLLGTDIHIGEPDTCEQRVAITPGQTGALKSWLANLGIKLNLLVVKDAGTRARFPDADYVAEGAVIVKEQEIPSLSPPDVVHASRNPPPTKRPSLARLCASVRCIPGISVPIAVWPKY